MLIRGQFGVPITGVAFSLDTSVPAHLRDTLIVARGGSLLAVQAAHTAVSLGLGEGLGR